MAWNSSLFQNNLKKLFYLFLIVGYNQPAQSKFFRLLMFLFLHIPAIGNFVFFVNKLEIKLGALLFQEVLVKNKYSQVCHQQLKS